jgi:UDP-glucose 4-epimerase
MEAMLLGLEKTRNQVETYNMSSEDQITVTEIAQTVTQEMGLKDVEFKFTGGVDGRGWKGDVKNMLLDISKLSARWFVPKMVKNGIYSFLGGLGMGKPYFL